MREEIDFVVTWVDDRDLAWRQRRDEYLGATVIESPEAASSQRYRDWDLLKYWFRGVEMFAPWVRRIHFVTENPVPSWLAVEHPKVNIVRHADFIPSQFLPTFNSRAIELNLHRIEGLSERFVYFNDDAYLLQPVRVEHFFRNGLPVAFAVATALTLNDNLSHAMLNNVGVLNRNFSKRRVMMKRPADWFSPRYGVRGIQNLLLLPWAKFTGLHVHHLPQALTRSGARRIWDAEHEMLAKTSASRFRRLSDVNPFLLSWWLVCEGRFAPGRLAAYGKFLPLHDETLAEVCNIVERGMTPVACINDADVTDFPDSQRRLDVAFQKRFPDRSSFERVLND